MVDLAPSKISPNRPRVDDIEELIRIKRLNQLDQATFEREMAKLRNGLVSAKSIRNKEIFINILLGLVFVILVIFGFRLLNVSQYTYALITLFFLIVYSIVIFGLHNKNVKKIILSMKSVKVEK